MKKNRNTAIFFDNGVRWKKIKKGAAFLWFSTFSIVVVVIFSLVYSPFGVIKPSDARALNEKIEIIQETDRTVYNQGTFLTIEDVYGEAVVKRTGENKRQVVLTFDDGPDPVNTPAILEILKKYHIPATFFMTGNQMYKHPDIGQNVLDQGSDIGIHTFSHYENENDEKLSPLNYKIELDFTQKVFAQLYGFKTNIFRIPYVGIEDEMSYDALQYIREAQLRDLVVSAPTVDSHDWQTTDPEIIYQNSIKSDVQTVVLLLHDLGKEREATVLALPKIIEFYQSRGYEFTTVSQMADEYGKESWKPLTFVDQISVPIAYHLFRLYKESPMFFDKGFIVGFIIVVVHTSLFLLLSAIQIIARKRKLKGNKKSFEKLVSVIIPVYNEEKVIEACLHSILKSTYPNLEVIVTDDGSTDETISKAQLVKDNRITIIANSHVGKHTALNNAIKQAKGTIIVTIDADTRVLPGAIYKLVQEFNFPRVGAVAGYIRVGNKDNILAKLQSIEYTLNQAVEKRVMDLGGSVLVVPGAFGAWRKSVIRLLGGFSPMTLTEDFDLTLKLIKKGYQVRFADNAIAYTEAPTSLIQLIKQRFRWNFGNLQVYAKYKSMIGNKKYKATGLVFLPRAVFLQILLTLTMPLVDIFILLNLLIGERQLTVYFLLFYLAFYYVIAIFSHVTLKESWKELFYLPLLRFGYTQLMYLIFYQALLQAARGQLVMWTKIHHKGELSYLSNSSA